ncbi:MAG: helix-turn-helix domain-containing protein [Planctomycetota bacterium]|nr:helix-turn-helix domain-containing protein [Planctomycetota bacterium]
MDKMFYSLEEAAQKLGKSVEDVRQMAARGQLQEFRDRDKLMFKREQVDLLAGGDDDGMIPLAADSGELKLSSSGTGMTLDQPKGGRKDSDGSAIGIFEADATDDADANAVTRVSTSPTAGFDDPGRSGSGSGGLLDLKKEADDTSLGQGLMDDVYGSDTVAQQTTADIPGASDGGGALFESPGASETEVAAPVMVAAEPYDGTWSGIAGGLAVGMVVALMLGMATLILGFTSAAGGGTLQTIGENFFILVGVAAGVTVIGAVIGMVLGKRS